MERSLEEKIQSQRKSNIWAVVILVAATVIAVLVYELLSAAQYMAHSDSHPSFWDLIFGFTSGQDVFVESLITLLIAAVAWHWRGMQRDDLYTEVLDKSTFALEHFRDQIDAEIERRAQ